jgi:hypothetical protein
MSAPRRAGWGWDYYEDEQLKDLVDKGLTVAQLAERHERTRGAIEARLEKLQINTYEQYREAGWADGELRRSGKFKGKFSDEAEAATEVMQYPYPDDLYAAVAAEKNTVPVSALRLTSDQMSEAFAPLDNVHTQINWSELPEESRTAVNKFNAEVFNWKVKTENSMKDLLVTTKTFVGTRLASDLNEDDLLNAIESEAQKLKRLEELGVESEAIKKLVKRHTENRKKLEELLADKLED